MRYKPIVKRITQELQAEVDRLDLNRGLLDTSHNSGRYQLAREILRLVEQAKQAQKGERDG